MSDLILTSSPHLHGTRTTRSIMLDVVIALFPTLVAATVLFGFRALLVTLVCVGTCVLSEFLFRKLLHRTTTVDDLSAVVTGMILAFNLPVTVPYWMAAFGSVVAILVVKELFGGIGKNFANPAATARIILALSFGAAVGRFVTPVNWVSLGSNAELVSSATPLSGGELPSLLEMFLGLRAGCLGETCALTLLLGFVYLLIRKVITWQAPVCFVGGVFVLTALAGLIPGVDILPATYQVLSGGLLLGAVFMATDYSTTPMTAWGKAIFGFGCALQFRFYPPSHESTL